MLTCNAASFCIAFLSVLAPASANPDCSRSAFPETAFSEFGPNARALLRREYAALLCSLGETALHDARGADFAVRLVVHASWGAGVLIRIEQSVERSAGTTKKWREDIAADNRPIVMRQQQRFAVLQSDVLRLKRAIDDLGLRSASSVDEIEVVDGVSWFVEIMDGGQYQVLVKTSPRLDAPIQSFADLVLDIADVQPPSYQPNEDRQ